MKNTIKFKRFLGTDYIKEITIGEEVITFTKEEMVTEETINQWYGLESRGEDNG